MRRDLAAHHRHGVHRTWARHHDRWWRPGSRAWWYYRPYPWWRPAWAWGVFYYPPPYAYGYYGYYGYPTSADGTGGESPPEPEARRQVERARTASIGVRGGSYLGDYRGSGGFGDFGLGIAARYRATEALGLELAWQYHNATWASGTDRVTQPFSASVELFAFPWSKFNPYVSTGLTWAHRNYQDTLHDVWGEPLDELSVEDTLFGPHVGLGLEFGVGSRASVNLEGRAIGFLNVEEGDPTVPSALQGTMGVNYYF